MGARQSSAVDRALKLIARGITAYAAAKKEGLSMTTVYRALDRHPDILAIAEGHRERKRDKAAKKR